LRASLRRKEEFLMIIYLAKESVGARIEAEAGSNPSGFWKGSA